MLAYFLSELAISSYKHRRNTERTYLVADQLQRSPFYQSRKSKNGSRHETSRYHWNFLSFIHVQPFLPFGIVKFPIFPVVKRCKCKLGYTLHFHPILCQVLINAFCNAKHRISSIFSRLLQQCIRFFHSNIFELSIIELLDTEFIDGSTLSCHFLTASEPGEIQSSFHGFNRHQSVFIKLFYHFPLRYSLLHNCDGKPP